MNTATKLKLFIPTFVNHGVGWSIWFHKFPMNTALPREVSVDFREEF